MISQPVPESAADNPERMVRGGATFAIAAILQRAAPLLLLPVFALLLSPTEFGEISVIVTVAAALTTLLSFGLETAVFRGYRLRQGDAGARHTYVNTLGLFAITVPVIGAAVAAAVAGPALARALDVPVDALVIGCVGAAIAVSATLIPLTLLRAQERLRDYLTLTTVQVVLSVSLSLAFVGALGLGVFGWMLATTLGALFLLGWGLVTLSHHWTSKFDFGVIRSALGFGIPLVPHAFGHWVLAISDRAIIAAAVGAAAAGPYYAAFLVASPVTLAAVALSQASQPAFAEAAPAHARPRSLTRVVTSHAIVVLLAAAAVGLVGPPAVLTLLPDSYAPAAGYIPWLAVGACLFGLYLMPMNAITITAGHTRYVWIITGAAAAANLALNLVLVPQIGPLAAAVNTAIGYAVLLVGMSAYMRLVCAPPINYDIRRLASGALLIGVTCLVGALLSPADPLISLVAHAALVGLLIVLLVVLGPLSHEARVGLHALGFRHTEVVR